MTKGNSGCADAAPLRKVTDNECPKVPLRDGIAEMVELYYRSFWSSAPKGA
jgi:hypothetical protein